MAGAGRALTAFQQRGSIQSLVHRPIPYAGVGERETAMTGVTFSKCINGLFGLNLRLGCPASDIMLSFAGNKSSPNEAESVQCKVP